MDDQRDFVTRQYAGLVAGGMDAAAARTRLSEVLGASAVRWLDGKPDGTDRRDGDATAARLMDAATRLGGNPASAHAAFIRATDEARLLALDWWRPIRTFLLYIVFLLALAIVIAIVFAADILPAFGRMHASLRLLKGDGDEWLTNEVLRVFGPLVVIAALLVILAFVWFGMRRRIARLRPLAGHTRLAWLYGRSGMAWRTLLGLEYASALKAGGAADDALLEPALRLADWPQGQPFANRGDALGEKLEQAQRLGTFEAELEWQRRLYWSRTQSHLELARDRLTLASRVIFYILIGYMVTVLYIPIFSIARLFGGAL